MVELDNKVLTLSWEGPYRITDKELFKEENPGLYLFTVEINGVYSLHYIGMTTEGLSSRIVGKGGRTGHLRDYISGRYYLYNSDKLKLNTLDTKNKEHVEYHLKDNYEEFFSNLEKYQTIARNFLENIRFFLCPFKPFKSTIDVDIPENILLAESILLDHYFHLRIKNIFPL